MDVIGAIFPICYFKIGDFFYSIFFNFRKLPISCERDRAQRYKYCFLFVLFAENEILDIKMREIATSAMLIILIYETNYTWNNGK